MVDVAAQLSQWTFDKPVVAAHPPRSSSTASSPNLSKDAPETLRLDTAAAQASRKDAALFHERYNSSEEDLTTGGSDSESEYDYDDVVVHDPVKECKARTLSVSRWNKGKSCDMAVTVSYAFAGRPKVVEDCRSPLDRPAVQLRSASLANVSAAPMHTLQKADKAQRQSMTLNAMSRLASSSTTRPASPVEPEPEPRRPSTSYSPAAKDMGAPQSLTSKTPTSKTSTSKTPTSKSSISKTSTSKTSTAPAPMSNSTASSRSISPALSEAARWTSAADLPSSRSSVFGPSQSQINLTRTNTTQTFQRQSYLPPHSPALSFLSLDPYEKTTTDSSSPIIKKPGGHRRLRSISLKMALAKIAIAPAKKPSDAQASRTSSPAMPQTAPLDRPTNPTGPNRLRRASTILRPKSRQGESIRYSTQSAAPPLPSPSSSMFPARTSSRMVARGANEIEPTLILPDFPPNSDDDARIKAKSKALRKRKSLMDFMDSLA